MDGVQVVSFTKRDLFPRQVTSFSIDLKSLCLAATLFIDIKFAQVYLLAIFINIIISIRIWCSPGCASSINMRMSTSNKPKKIRKR